MRQVAEDVRSAFPRWSSDPELVLIDVDPHHIHAFWSLPAEAVEAARHTLGATGSHAPMVLRVSTVADTLELGSSFDVEVVGLHGRCYVDVWETAREYRSALGLRQPDGQLLTLIASDTVRLPALGPAQDTATPAAATPQHKVEPPTAVAPPGPLSDEPVRHPIPLPPSEPQDDEAAGKATSAPMGPTSPSHPSEPSTPAGEALGIVAMPRPGLDMADALPDPVRHPFPLPPMESGEYDPSPLIGGFLPAELIAEPTSPHPESTPPQAAAPEGPAAFDPGANTPEVAPAVDFPQTDAPAALPLENVLTLSSFALGRETVAFEINAEVHIFGRVRPGTRLQLSGRDVPLRPDGTFSISRPLPNGALLLSSLLVDDADRPAE
ncbi:MAG: DUF4912 domain-containing protein [Rhodospirillales bacterium]|nr:DUF4912 domain-containing protein [Rhodospirillales bacterium]